MRKGADCLSKWVGESERQLRLLFEQVTPGPNAAPCWLTVSVHVQRMSFMIIHYIVKLFTVQLLFLSLQFYVFWSSK